MALTEKQKQVAWTTYVSTYEKKTTGLRASVYAAVEAILADQDERIHNALNAEQASAAEQGQGSLMRSALSRAPYGYYCEPGRCKAPKIMGVQQPCRDPEKAAGLVRQAPAQPPAGDVVERMLDAFMPGWRCEPSPERQRKNMTAALAVAREERDAQWEKAIREMFVDHPDSFGCMDIDEAISYVRARLAKPAERVTIGIGGDSNGPGTFVYLDNNWMITFRGTNRDKDAERYANGLREEIKGAK